MVKKYENRVPKELINPLKKKNEKKMFMINGRNATTAAKIKSDILSSDLCNIYVKMGLTGRDIRVDKDGNEEDVGELEQPERMKIMKTLVDKVLPASKEEAVGNSEADKWALKAEELMNITIEGKVND